MMYNTLERAKRKIAHATNTVQARTLAISVTARIINVFIVFLLLSVLHHIIFLVRTNVVIILVIFVIQIKVTV